MNPKFLRKKSPPFASHVIHIDSYNYSRQWDGCLTKLLVTPSTHLSCHNFHRAKKYVTATMSAANVPCRYLAPVGCRLDMYREEIICMQDWSNYLYLSGHNSPGAHLSPCCTINNNHIYSAYTAPRIVLCWGRHTEAESKWLPFCRQHFPVYFFKESCCILI